MTNTASAPVTVLLTGGPNTLTDEQRVMTVTGDTDKVKLQVGHGYEHFSDSGESTDSHRVFHWCDRTAIAE